MKGVSTGGWGAGPFAEDRGLAVGVPGAPEEAELPAHTSVLFFRDSPHPGPAGLLLGLGVFPGRCSGKTGEREIQGRWREALRRSQDGHEPSSGRAQGEHGVARARGARAGQGQGCWGVEGPREKRWV